MGAFGVERSVVVSTYGEWVYKKFSSTARVNLEVESSSNRVFP